MNARFVRPVRHIGLLLTRPGRTLTALAHSGGIDPLGPFLVYLFVLVCVNARLVFRFASLVGEAPRIAFENLGSVLAGSARQDLLLCAIVATIAAAFARLFARPRASLAAAATTATALLVVVALQRALGAVLALAGADLWWMPHHAVDGFVVRARDHVLWVRFAIKCGVSYLVPGLMVLAWLHGLWSGAVAAESHEDAAPGPVIVRNAPLTTWQRGVAGLALTLLVVLALGTVADVVRVSAQLKPALPGVTLLDEALPLLAPAGPRTGATAPPADERARFALGSLRGSVVVLDFWASWCAPCRRSIPELSSLQTELAARGLRVVGVNREPEDPAGARRAWLNWGPSFPTLLDDRAFGDRLGLTSLPTTYVVDRAGVLRHLHLGYTDPAVLRAEVSALLDER